MITGTFDAQLFNRSLLAILHAAARCDVLHNKHKNIYIVITFGRMYIFALNGKRLASVSFPVNAPDGTLVLSMPTINDILHKFKTVPGSISLLALGDDLMLSIGALIISVKPEEEHFSFNQYLKCFSSAPLMAEPVQVKAQYLKDMDRSCRALEIDDVELTIRGPGLPVIFKHSCERFEFLFVAMACRGAL